MRKEAFRTDCKSGCDKPLHFGFSSQDLVSKLEHVGKWPFFEESMHPKNIHIENINFLHKYNAFLVKIQYILT